MKARIQEALRRRHRKGDEGFTLIELLVVILIIAILAAVGIVALLSALNSGKKSAAKTSLRNAITSVKSAQTGRGITDFGTLTAGDMNTEDPDLRWVAAPISGTGNTNVVHIENSTATLTLATRADNGICYYAFLDSQGASVYGSAAAASCDAGAAPTTLAAPEGPTGARTSSVGWSL